MNENPLLEVSEEMYSALKLMKGAGMSPEDLDNLLSKYQNVLKQEKIKDALDSLYKVVRRTVYGEFIIDGNEFIDDLKKQCFSAMGKYENLNKDNK